MTWPEVAEMGIAVVALLGVLFFVAVILNGWPGREDD